MTTMSIARQGGSCDVGLTREATRSYVSFKRIQKSSRWSDEFRQIICVACAGARRHFRKSAVKLGPAAQYF
jgi:hypothetical protein